MNPRSAALNVRISVPRSITLAICSSPCGERDVVHGRRDRRERAEDLIDADARRERRVALGIERLGLRHAARHPQHDDGVGAGAPRRRSLREHRLASGERRQRRGGGRPHEPAAADGAIDARSSACSIDKLELRLHRDRPDQIGKRLARTDAARQGCAAPPRRARRSAADGARPSRCQKTRSIASATDVDGAGGGSGVPARGRNQPLHVGRRVEHEEPDLRIERRADVGPRVLEADRCRATA